MTRERPQVYRSTCLCLRAVCSRSLTPSCVLQCRVPMMHPASSIIFRMMPPWTFPTMLASSGRISLEQIHDVWASWPLLEFYTNQSSLSLKLKTANFKDPIHIFYLPNLLTHSKILPCLALIIMSLCTSVHFLLDVDLSIFFLLAFSPFIGL